MIFVIFFSLLNCHPRSSEVAERLFCGGCGSQVGMDYGKALEPDSLWLTLGLEPYCNLIT